MRCVCFFGVGMPSKNGTRRASERCAADNCGKCVSVIGVDIEELL